MCKIIFSLIIFTMTILPQPKRPLTVEDLWSMKRIENFDVSPNGKNIALEVKIYSMDENKGNSNIFLINADGSNLRTFKNSDKNETKPKFSPDGKRIAYLLANQIWTANIDGSNEKQLTNLSTDVSGIRWSNDGTKILFVSSVYPDCPDDDCNKQRKAEKDSNKVKAKIITELMYRHWNEWRDAKRSHLFLLDVESKKTTDLNFGSDFDVPPIALGSDNDYNFSPDGNEAAFTMNESNQLAVSTNNDIFIVKLNDIDKQSAAAAKKISTSKGNDNQPVYSPDGKYIAFTSMLTAGHESDQAFLFLYDRETGGLTNLSKDLEKSIGEFIWSPNSKTIYFVSANEIYESIYKLDISTKNISIILKEGSNKNLKVSSDGKTIFFKRQKSTQPFEIFSMNTDGKNLKQITHLNSELLSQIEMNPLDTIWTKGAGDYRVQSILIKPPFFDSTKKYPLIFLIHGGPQGHWNDEFHFRWNTELFASKGYVIIAPNPTGSTGYGQRYTNDISKDWGGRAYEDLMNVYDYAVKNLNYIDAKNTFAAGASFGGFMINWIEGHTDRFNALVSHDGVFNTISAWGTTEELWFTEWEFNGTPWENKQLYEKWNPQNFIQNAKTPMLIIQGQNDFRVAEEQAFQLFTSLQRLGVDSKLLLYPDEYHWVTKPQNARLWWNTVFDWFEKYKK